MKMYFKYSKSKYVLISRSIYRGGRDHHKTKRTETGPRNTIEFFILPSSYQLMSKAQTWSGNCWIPPPATTITSINSTMSIYSIIFCHSTLMIINLSCKADDGREDCLSAHLKSAVISSIFYYPELWVWGKRLDQEYGT